MKHFNKLLGQKNLCLYGQTYINDIFCNLHFRVGVTSFFQINHRESQKAIQYIIKNLINSPKSTRVIDAFSGIGTITLPIAGF